MENKVDNSWAGYSIKEDSHLKLEQKWARQNYKTLKRIGVVPCGRILDLGCSRGFFLGECKKNGIQVNGIDVDPEIIDGDKVRKCNMEKDRFPYEDNTFDVVFSSGVLQHIAKPPANLMQEVYRVLKPGGKLALHVRNERSWINILFSQYDNFRHKSTWTSWSLRQMFNYYKLKVMYLEPKFLGAGWLRWLPFKWAIGSNIIIVGKK
jgi:SAM-dependent methyltransferase